ncbi:MAG: hypothetical protein M3Z96_14010, partial [Pseudomonadota bacterium]|nr:hypothetical protein [Pseudomonadota bacterium]
MARCGAAARRRLRAAARSRHGAAALATVRAGGVQFRRQCLCPARRPRGKREDLAGAIPGPGSRHLRAAPRHRTGSRRFKARIARAQRVQPSLLDRLARHDYVLPPLHILGEPRKPAANKVSEDALGQNARLLEGVLEDFGVKGEIIHVRPGPVVTLY